MSNSSENLFESIYVDIVNYCMLFYTNKNENESLLDYNRFVHIKGGSSIKYHLMKAQFPSEYHTNITSDLDLFLICSDDYKDENIEDFISGLHELFTHYSITHETLNGLTTIAFNGKNIIDLVVFTENYVENDPDTSMFFYACKQLGKSEIDYFEELKQIDTELLNENHSLLEKKTFTSVKFEYYATIKGIEIYNGHLQNVQLWKEKYIFFLNRSNNSLLSEFERNEAKYISDRYKKQSEDEFIEKLQKKLTRYQKKLILLKQLTKN